MTLSEIIAAYNALRAEYLIAKCEARACGQDFPSFEDWSGQDSPRRRAEARWQEHFDNDTLDLY